LEKGKSEFNLHTTVDGEGHTKKMRLGIPGEFNVRNAIAAIIAANEISVPEPVIANAIENFKGIWRRFETVGEYKGATIISDYGHHPTAIKETVRTLKDMYLGKRIILVYQPHQHNRTKNLFNDFVDVFAIAPLDILVLNEIYDVAGREENDDQNVSSKDLANAIKEKAKYHIHYTATLKEVHEWLEENVKKNDIVVIMGAGDIDNVARELIK